MVTVNQGYRDQEALDKLKAIERANLEPQSCAIKFITITRMLTQDLLLNYLTLGEHSHICDIVACV